MRPEILVSDLPSRLHARRGWRLTRVYQAVALCLALPAVGAYSEEFFNPAFLSNDPSVVADLSRFEKGEGQAPGIYRVDIYLNNEHVTSRDIRFTARKKTDAVAPGAQDDTGLVACITRPMLEMLSVNLAAFPKLANAPKDQCLSLPDSIQDASTTFDFELQKLYISIPQAALKNSGRGYIPPEDWDDGIPAALLNYDFTGSNSSGDYHSDNAFLNLNSGLNWEGWRLRDYSTWNYYRTSQRRTSDWQHISTYLQRTLVPLKGDLTLGDSSTPGDVFDSLGFRGVQLASDDNMLPDSLRGFAPSVRGVARSNARVTIRQNGYVIYQTYVSPGAFSIDDLYPVSSSGDLQVTITESDNSSTNFTVPYSSVPVLQREGRVKYAVTGGKYRSNYDEQSKPGFAQGTVIWGVPYGFTLYGGTQVSNNYQAYAAGVGKNLGDLGAVSADVTQAYSTLSDGSDHQGQSLRFLYAKSLNSFGTNFQLLGYRYSTQGFYTLDETSYKNLNGYNVDVRDTTPVYQNYYDLSHAKKGKLQISINQQLGREYGSLFFTGSRQDYWHTDQTTELWQLGYSGAYDGISYSLTYSQSKSLGLQDTDKLVAFNVSLPLGQWLSGGSKADITHSTNSTYLTYNANTDTHGRNIQQAGINGTLLRDNNLNYSVMQGYGSQGIGNSGSANLTYQGTYGNSNVGYNYSRNYRQVNYGLNGGLVAHANGLTLSQPLGETNVLIKAPGARDVSLVNATGVSTDWRGYAVIPYANTYHTNRIALDVDTLNTHTEIENAVVNVIPTKGALVRADFNTHLGARAIISLAQRSGKPIPFGASVSDRDNHNSGIVGDNGQVFLSGLPQSGTLKVEWGPAASEQCTINYTLPEGSENKPVTYVKAGCR